MRTVIALIVVVIFASDFQFIGTAAAETKPRKEDLLWVVYRDSQGELTKDSEKFAKLLEKKASKEGYVTLWLTANVVFNPYVDELTDEQVDEQDQMVHDFFGEVLQPLVDSGAVWHPSKGPNISGPGCLIRADAAGVAKLVKDSRILHIVEV